METLTEYLSLYGKWSREEQKIIFSAGTDDDSSHGLALFGYDLEDGQVEVDVTLSGDLKHGSGRNYRVMI
ncbi:MAG TPA: hypothetical protein VLS45_07690 [Methylomicrobium sp.]|jgi:hypothetical protein|nr:hypothetical protein [Methylomicrobium sp.]